MLDFSSAKLPFRKKESLLNKTEEPALKDQSLTPKTAWYKNLKPWQYALIAVVLLLLSTTTVVGIYTFKTVMTIKTQAQEARFAATQAYASFKGQNLPETQLHLTNVQTAVANIQAEYGKLGLYKYLPIARGYYLDGEHGLKAAEAGLQAGEKSLQAITPYADILGFTGEGTFVGTTEDRVKVVLETVDKITPILDEIGADLATVEAELAAIDPTRYPEDFSGYPVREYVLQAQGLSTAAYTAITEYRPVIEQLPEIAGGRGERKKYLILFQNDNELRPTGGFLTAYAIINVENGKVEAERSDDIYELDQKFNERITIPEKLGRYLTTERYWNLRDMNISPDFEQSMTTFFEHYQEIPGEPGDEIDGIIAVDTEFLKDLLAVLGPVEVPGYGTFSAENDPRCDCPQIIYVLSEILTRPTPYIRENRKGILGPLMRSTLTKAYGAPKQQWPELFQTGWESVQGRHIQFYFLDESAQQAAQTAAAAGKLAPTTEGQDFLAIVNANLGGAKSNLFIEYEVNQTISAPENGFITKTIEITYKNTRKADNCNLEAGLLCLNSTLRDWTRLYVPAGSELVDAQGFSEAPETYEENGLTVFDGFFSLEPLSQAKLKLTYKVPYEDTETYKLKMWKQGGINEYQTLIDVTGGQEQLLIDKDTTYETIF